MCIALSFDINFKENLRGMPPRAVHVDGNNDSFTSEMKQAVSL